MADGSVVSSKLRKFYIDGAWVDAIGRNRAAVVNPATEEVIAEIALGGQGDVDTAVAAAKRAFRTFSQTTREDRLALLRAILDGYMKRFKDVATTLSSEMGAPMRLAMESQAAIGRDHLKEMMRVLERFELDTLRGTTMLTREPIGVVAAITPWNWPINQIVCKVAPAIAAGCTMVLKPSEIAPLNALIFAEVMHDAGVPKGVFNLVNGDGPTVGQMLAAHPDVDMVSFTGSTRGGIAVAKAAADKVKRVHQELGGKSANILLDDVDLEHSVSRGVVGCYSNGGQSCNAPTRMLVPAKLQAKAAAIAKKAAESFVVGDPSDMATTLGPMVSEMQFNKVQALIQAGIEEGAKLVTGGVGRPEGLNRGYFVRPTVFTDVKPGMRVEREEIFGPVLSIIGYKSEDEAIEIANNTVYGLAAYVQSKDQKRAQAVARQMRAGDVYINYPAWDASAPFGGYKQSGNGREYGEFGLDAFQELKAIVGFEAKR